MSAQLTFERVPATTAEPAAPTRHGRLRRAWLRILQTVQEMNYVNRRLVEVQAPWTVDPQWHRR
jgi:Myb/SANT-like DNA-binding domain